MGIRELYDGNLLQESFQRLQSMRIPDDGSEHRRLITKIEGPEVLDDNLLIDWLALNYLWAMNFDHKGNLIMGEIGGTIPQHPENGGLVLAIADASLDKVLYGIQQVQDSRKTGDRGLILRLEREIEMPLESRGPVTVVNGNRNLAHYDFITGVARAEPIEVITTNTFLLLGADGFNVLTNKQLPNEQYVFHVPVNEELFRAMRAAKGSDIDDQLKLLRTVKDQLLPSSFIAGFHIRYDGDLVTVRPLIPQRDSADLPTHVGLTVSASPIAYLGSSSPYGQLTGVLNSFLN